MERSLTLREGPRGRVSEGIMNLARLGLVVAGVLGIVLAINASLDNEYVGAGVLLIALGVCFGILVFRAFIVDR